MENHLSKTSEQFLTCTLGKEIFALEIGSVREVLELTTITEIPRTPDYMQGIINLRGSAVPVMDLRQKLGMSKRESTVETCIIIIEVELDSDSIIMGALVDSVREVFETETDEIQPAPKMGAAINADFIRGMGEQAGEFIIIIDIAKIFSAEELGQASLASLNGNPHAAQAATDVASLHG